MCRRPARSAVQLARCIHHIIKRVLGLHLSLWPHIWPHLPTASCSHWIFILDSGHLPTAILSIWLLILVLAIILLVLAVVAVVLSSFLLTKALVSCVRLRSPW